MSDPRNRLVTCLILAAALLAGIAALCITPPWEGADETAHWSYVQELADAGRAPRPGQDYLSTDVDRYAGPRPYSDSAPFDDSPYPTYRSYRAHPQPSRFPGPTRFAQGQVANWQAQHPPLYYLALVPAYRLAHGWTMPAHLRLLRLESFLFAWLGLAIGAAATLASREAWVRVTAPMLAAWPFLAPQAFPELARLGNDSMCLLEMGIAWALILRLTARGGGWITAALLGAVLGLGLLTKAFFLPIGAGVAAFAVFLGWRSGFRVRGLGLAAVILGVAAVIGGWWYLAEHAVTGDFTGGGDFVQLKRAGGLAAGLDKNYSPFAMARGLAALAATFAWTGTWSLARPPEVLILGPLLLVGLPIAVWIARLKALPPLAFAPVFLVAPMLAGLLYHVLAFVALTGRGASTPGYYLHILAAPLAFAVALGWRKGVVLPLLWTYTALFTLGVWTLEVSLFSGCAGKLGDDPHFSFTGAGCFVDPAPLAKLGQPGLAAGAAGAALLLLAAAGWLSRGALAFPARRAPSELAAL